MLSFTAVGKQNKRSRRYNSDTNQQMQFWEDSLARAYDELRISEKLDDCGGKEWWEEQIRWAKMQINNLMDLEHHKKGA